MDFSLNIKQEQKLILTQSMKTSLNILEMSGANLEKFIKKEISKNPLLEIDFSSKNSNFQKKDSNFSSPLDYATEEKNLIDFLEEQIRFLDITKEMRIICIFIINNLDKRGFLTVSREELKDYSKFPLLLIDRGIDIIKTLEPVGICAENLEECLIIQLHKKNIYDIKLEFIIHHLMPELAQGKFDFIAKKLEVDEKTVLKYLDVIKTLNPLPSRGFYMGDMINYIEPEAEIKMIGEKYQVIMSTKNIPKLKIKNIENKKENNSKIKTYMSSAKNLIKAIEKRQTTLEKILNVILEKQYDYFSNPKSKLKTLTLKDISKDLNIHESTVSRAIKNKYILTDRGLQRIKDMFIINNKKIFIKEKIENLILKEDRNNPLTDKEIVYLLEKEKFKIARRTVVKYREELGIKPSYKRKLDTEISIENEYNK